MFTLISDSLRRRYALAALGILVAFLTYRSVDEFAANEGSLSLVETAVAQTMENEAARLYKVWLVVPDKDNDRSVRIVVSVEPKRFNRDDLIVVAKQIGEAFKTYSKIEASLLDDEDTARLFSKGLVNYPTFETAERARYYLDRKKCKEWVKFLGRKRDGTERLKIKCSLPD